MQTFREFKNEFKKKSVYGNNEGLQSEEDWDMMRNYGGRHINYAGGSTAHFHV